MGHANSTWRRSGGYGGRCKPRRWLGPLPVGCRPSQRPERSCRGPKLPPILHPQRSAGLIRLRSHFHRCPCLRATPAGRARSGRTGAAHPCLSPCSAPPRAGGTNALAPAPTLRARPDARADSARCARCRPVLPARTLHFAPRSCRTPHSCAAHAPPGRRGAGCAGSGAAARPRRLARQAALSSCGSAVPPREHAVRPSSAAR
eukprot:1068936-Rhodomonas_salina.2